ncbi:hypothetical protein SKAU_G00272140 [Synaphobranchus kaupii]|uniref:Uncharacterized protein n=1 Tax=Synaphobranchus kaupii TaxID=118154 RepID=A0A9Q1F0H9_SYNKA|nr:hypothetical protein SKAU_G00272140 [Synaphobranchus kaupii]
MLNSAGAVDRLKGPSVSGIPAPSSWPTDSQLLSSPRATARQFDLILQHLSRTGRNRNMRQTAVPSRAFQHSMAPSPGGSEDPLGVTAGLNPGHVPDPPHQPTLGLRRPDHPVTKQEGPRQTTGFTKAVRHVVQHTYIGEYSDVEQRRVHPYG